MKNGCVQYIVVRYWVLYMKFHDKLLPLKVRVIYTWACFQTMIRRERYQTKHIAAGSVCKLGVGRSLKPCSLLIVICETVNEKCHGKRGHVGNMEFRTWRSRLRNVAKLVGSRTWQKIHKMVHCTNSNLSPRPHLLWPGDENMV